MNRSAMRAVARKDLAVVWRSRAVMLPIVLVPVILLLVLPLVVALVPDSAMSGQSALSELGGMIRGMPAPMRERVTSMTERQQWVYLGLVHLMAPMFLMIPVMVASVIAADSFAGERERGTLEVLLHSPTTDRELFLAKVLAPWLAALAVTLGSFAFYTAVVNAVGAPIMGRIFFPDPTWLVLALWVSPGVAALGLGTMVLVSSRVRGFQEAYQLGGVIVLPIVLLVVAQVQGVMLFDVPGVLLLGVVVWAIGGGLLVAGARTFHRDRMLARR